LCAFCCLVDALPGQCLRRKPGTNPLVAAVFRTNRLLREHCSATCQRRRRPGQARHRQGRLQITADLREVVIGQRVRSRRTRTAIMRPAAAFRAFAGLGNSARPGTRLGPGWAGGSTRRSGSGAGFWRVAGRAAGARVALWPWQGEPAGVVPPGSGGSAAIARVVARGDPGLALRPARQDRGLGSVYPGR
jgi:hypothetical protein